MAEWSNDDRTEAPTPRRREDARKQGQVALSPDLTAAMTMLAAALALWYAGPLLGGRLQDLFSESLPAVQKSDWGVPQTLIWSRWFLTQFLQLTGALMAGLCVVGLLTSGVQAGLHVSTDLLSPNWTRLSPTEGWSKIVSMEGVMRGLLSVLKLACASAIGISIVWSRWSDLRIGMRGPLNGAVALTWEVAAAVILSLTLAALVLAAIDYFFRWFRNEQKLRMTRQEIKDELKDDQGDPQIRSRVRALQRQAATRRALKEVPRATLVVTNPTHVSVALLYKPGQAGAPKVIAKGIGRLALRIREIAREHGIPIQEKKPLARALYKLVEVGQEIPLELYHAVAEILAAVYRRKRAA
jgi:flagellar biosynthetic protein FlhB